VQAALTAESLEVWRGGHCLFESLDFDLVEGKIALLVGPNGAGKTTLLRVLAGLTPPTTGRVTWRGMDVRGLEVEQRAEIAYRGHLDGLKNDLTVAENLEFYRSIRGSGAPIDALLRALRIRERRNVRVRNLSAGQRRRAGLASLRLGGARLWILDEPMTNLDADGRALVAAWIEKHVDGGGMAVVATHRPDELSRSGALVVEL
jgi:heme exporter protein A